MQKQQSAIPLDPQRRDSMRFERLLGEGVKACQDMCADHWTDYNEHDSGVTILEQLCYAITDLGYRLDYSVPDLLAGPGAGRHSTLYTGDRVLGGAPLTVNDYRRVLYDRIHNLRNVWVVEADQGLLRIEAHAYKDEGTAKLRADLCREYHAQRSLGEDLAEVRVLTPVKLILECVLYVAADHDPEAVVADALFALAGMLSPAPAFSGVDQMLADGEAPDTIFDGPLLEHGVLPDTELTELAGAVTPGDVRSALVRTAGVVRVADLSLWRDGAAAEDKLVRDSHEVFELAAPDALPMRVVWKEQSFHWDPAAVQRRLASLQDAAGKREQYAQQRQTALAYRQAPLGADREISHYHSIQHQFPQVYGLGVYGVAKAGLDVGGDPAGQAQARRRRLAMARQLTAYLMPFEQVLANHHAQLANIGKLFSADRGIGQTYFSQPLVHYPAASGDAAGALAVLPATQKPPPPLAGEQLSVLVLARRPGTSELDEVLLRSREVAEPSQLYRLEADILSCGAHQQHWRVVRLGAELFHLVLSGRDGGRLAFGWHSYRSHHAAHRASRRMAAWLRVLDHDRAVRQRYVKRRSCGQYRLLLRGPHGAPMLGIHDLPRAGVEEARLALLREGRFPERYTIDHGGRLQLRLGSQAPYLVARSPAPLSGHAPLARASDECIAWIGRLARDTGLRDTALQVDPALSGPDGNDMPARVERYGAGLERLVRRFDPAAERRGRILDHLLARFNERFEDAALASADPRTDKDMLQRELNEWKSAFLRDYVPPKDTPGAGPSRQDPQRDQLPRTRAHTDVGTSRHLGCDYTDRHSSSGLERRLRLLLGIGGAGAVPAHGEQHAWWHYHASDGPGRVPVLDRGLVFEFEQPDALAALMRSGSEPSSYAIRSGGGRWRVWLRQPSVSLNVGIFSSKARAQVALDELLGRLRRLAAEPAALYADEQMVLVEHVLLRARARADAGRRAPDATRVTLMLPDWPLRFQSLEFRQLLTRVAGENCPAHLGLRCHWLDSARMARLKCLYGDWRELLAGHAGEALDGASADLAEFIDHLDPEHRDA